MRWRSMNVDPSCVYTVPHVRGLLGLPSGTMPRDSLDTTVNSTLTNVPVSHVSMDVNSYCVCTGSGFTGTHSETLMLVCSSKHNVTMLQHETTVLTAVFVTAVLDTQVSCVKWTEMNAEKTPASFGVKC